MPSMPLRLPLVQEILKRCLKMSSVQAESEVPATSIKRVEGTRLWGYKVPMVTCTDFSTWVYGPHSSRWKALCAGFLIVTFQVCRSMNVL